MFPTIKEIFTRSLSFLFLSLSLLILTNCVFAQAAPAIQWKVANPFRFISDQKAMDEIVKANDRVKPKDKPGATALEGELQKINLGDDQPLGWFSELAKNDHKKTCWDSRNLAFRDDGLCKDYVHPKFHAVRVWVTGLADAQNKQCEWFIDGVFFERQFCDRIVEIEKIEYGTGGKKVSVNVDGDPAVVTPRADVEVQDKLIVGLGDSYGSGEGNPDIPAKFNDRLTDTDSHLFSSTGLPTPSKNKGLGNEAQWLDRRCHRSMYSYQFKTALQIALSDPHWAVTFITYACSAAVTSQIVDKAQGNNDLKEYENVIEKPNLKKNRVYRTFPPQLESLKKDLCAAGKDCTNDKRYLRTIDYLLLSTGGNDIGFSKYVANVVFASTSWLMIPVKLIRKAKTPSAATVKNINALAGTYNKLRDTLVEKLNIKDCDKLKPCPRILLTAYPDPLYDEKGVMCLGERGEFKVPFGRDKQGARARRINRSEEFVIDVLKKVQSDTNNIWTFVDEHLSQYKEHGFCAQNKNSSSETAEILTIPVYRKTDGTLQWVYHAPDGSWIPFNYQHYRGYESRQRWFRLPVDAKLNIDQDISILNVQKDWFFIDEIAGIIHPTAEGLAVTADENAKKILDMENKSH
jgi:hypothetical protein